MKIKKIIFNVVVLSLFSYGAYAEVPKPNKCPSVEAITARGLDLVDEYIGSVGVISDKYDTDSNFTFAIKEVDGDNAAEQMKNAKNALPNLTFLKGPVREAYTPNWVCYYQAGKYYASAWTPANHKS